MPALKTIMLLPRHDDGVVVNATTIIARLPYSETIYKISTGGNTCDR